jgi:hypothetical protein
MRNAYVEPPTPQIPANLRNTVWDVLLGLVERRLLFATRNGTPWDANLLLKRKLRPLLYSLGIEAAVFMLSDTRIVAPWIGSAFR